MSFAIAPAAASAAAWGEELEVSGPTEIETGAYAPRVLTDDAGNATYLWLQRIEGGDDQILRSRVYRADGTIGPTRNVTLPSDEGQTTDFDAASDAAGGIRVAWMQTQTVCSPYCESANQFFTATLDSSGERVGEPLEVVGFPRGAANVNDVSLAVGPDGTAALGLSYYLTASEEPKISVWRLGPAATAAVDVSPDAEGPFNESLGVAVGSAGEVFAAWVSFDEGSFLSQVEEGAFLTEGEAAEPQVLSEGLALQWGYTPEPSIDEAGTATVVFDGQREGGEQRVYSAKLSPENVLSGPAPISPEGGYAYMSPGGSAAVPTGEVVATWEQEGSSWIASVAPDGTVGAPHDLLDGGEGGYPAVDVDSDGDGVVLAQGYDPEAGAYSVLARHFSQGGNPVGSVEAIGDQPDGTSNEALDVDVADSGSAAAAWPWETEVGLFEYRNEVFGALYDATPPSLTLILPPKAVAGSPLVMAAQGSDGNPISYDWDFGDGSGGEGPVVTHTFASPGTRTVSLTATDSAGNSITREGSIGVLDPAAFEDGTGTGAGGGADSGDKGTAAALRPLTLIVKAPPKKSRRRTARITFVSSQPGSSFECALDAEGWKPCSSPLRLRHLKPGRHRLRIRAIGPSGMLEAGGQTVRFKVLKPRRRHHRRRGGAG
jgi:hypothetical protein